MFYVYILETSDKSFYVGSTKDLYARIERHERGECRYTKSRLPVDLAYYEELETRSGALRRERQIKSWKSRQAVIDLINKN